MSDESTPYGPTDQIDARLAEEDRNILRNWRDSLITLDPRYHDKRLASAVARSLVNEDFRRELVEATKDAREDEATSQEGTVVRFHVNTPGMLHVILPPTAAEIESRISPIGESLRSRTSDASNTSTDDWNIGDPATDPPILSPPIGADGADWAEFPGV
jgi:hypothetical protein